MERRGEQARRALHGHLALLHRLQQRRLGARRGAVDLVREQQVGEDRPGPELKARLALVVDVRAGDVGRQEVRRELQTAELEPERLCERTRRERLSEPRHVLQEHVASREDAREHELQLLALSDHGSRHPIEHEGAALADFSRRQLRHSASSCSRTSSSSAAPKREEAAPEGDSVKKFHNSSPRSASARGLAASVHAVASTETEVRDLDDEGMERDLELIAGHRRSPHELPQRLKSPERTAEHRLLEELIGVLSKVRLADLRQQVCRDHDRGGQRDHPEDIEGPTSELPQEEEQPPRRRRSRRSRGEPHAVGRPAPQSARADVARACCALAERAAQTGSFQLPPTDRSCPPADAEATAEGSALPGSRSDGLPRQMARQVRAWYSRPPWSRNAPRQVARPAAAAGRHVAAAAAADCRAGAPEPGRQRDAGHRR